MQPGMNLNFESIGGIFLLLHVEVSRLVILILLTPRPLKLVTGLG